MALFSVSQIKVKPIDRYLCSISNSYSTTNNLDDDHNHKQKIQRALFFSKQKNPKHTSLKLCCAATQVFEHGSVLNTTINQLLTASPENENQIRSFLLELKDDSTLLCSFLQELKTLPYLRDEDFFCYSITLYGQANMFDRAIQAFQEMNNWGITPSNKSLNALLRAGNFARKYIEVSNIFDEFPIKYNIKPDLDTYNIVIKSFCEAGTPESIYRILEEIDKNKIQPDEITLSTALNGFHRQLKHEDVDKVLHIFDTLGPHLGLSVYNAKIRQLCDMDKVDEARALFDKISSRGMKLNKYTYQCLLSAYIKEENMEEVTRFFNEMYDKYLKPELDYHSYKKMVLLFCQNGDFETAQRVCNFGVWRRYYFEGSIMEQLFKGLESIGKLEKVRELRKLSRSYDDVGKPSLPPYSPRPRKD